MTKYRKKPVIVDAFQFSYDKTIPYVEWFEDAKVNGTVFFDGVNYC